jgi:alpha-mannosidase
MNPSPDDISSPNLPRNWLSRLTYPRICRVRDIAAAHIWKYSSSSLQFILGPRSKNPGTIPPSSNFSGAYALGSPFGSKFAYQWFEINLPKSLPADSWLHLESDGGEMNYWSNDRVFAGFDIEHVRHPLPAENAPARLEVLITKKKAALTVAQIETRNEVAWKAWNDLEILCEAVRVELELLLRPAGYDGPMGYTYNPPLDNASRPLRRLLARLEQAADIFDREGLPALAVETAAILREFPHDPQRLRIAATGHAHIDLAWCWPQHASVFKAAHTFASMQRLLELYPEFRFGYSQPCSYEAVQSAYPAVAEATRDWIENGRWEPEGAMYVESDTNLPCGEALLRSFSVGQESFIALSGKRSPITWLPDVFGFTGCLPRIMKEMGSDFLFTTKMHWNPVTFFPHSSFRWQGIDGTEVVVHLAQHSMGYILDARLKEFRQIEQLYRQSAVHDQALAPVGFGDGGGGTTYEQLERMRRVKDFYFCPPTEWVPLRDFFDGLDRVKSSLPAFAGELYLEYHRGVTTTQGRMKAVYREGERALQLLESARALTAAGPVPSEKWKSLIFSQFHDVLPGTSIREVYRDELARLDQLTLECRLEIVNLLGRGGKEEVVFNPHAYPFSRVMGKGQNLRFMTAPAFSFTRVGDCLRKPAEKVQMGPRELKNGKVRAVLDEKGYLSEFEIAGRKLPLSGSAARLAIYPENPALSDAWEIDRQSLANGAWVETPAEIRDSCHRNGLRGTLSVSRPVGTASHIITHYILEAEAEVLRIEFEIDWKEPRALLKLHFPTFCRGKMARFGTPFGSIQRPQLAGMPSDETQWEVPGSRWAQVTDDGEAEGLFVVTEAKYGFSCRDGDLTVSLLRSPAPPDGEFVDDLSRPGGELEFTDIGKHRIRLAIGAVTRETQPMQAHPAALADWLFTDPVLGAGGPEASPLPAIEWPATLVPCWVKPCESGAGFVVRAHEVGGRRGSFAVSPREGWTLCRSNALEEDGPVAELISYTPYDLVSLLFRRRQAVDIK